MSSSCTKFRVVGGGATCSTDISGTGREEGLATEDEGIIDGSTAGTAVAAALGTGPIVASPPSYLFPCWFVGAVVACPADVSGRGREMVGGMTSAVRVIPL